ncbi:hypothetical protein [Thermotoga sp. KOL6]|nr:hypothetical protein [Thermotoga sp. KOL6]
MKEQVNTIVFDLRRVLIHWNPYGYMAKRFDEKAAGFLNENIFDSHE